jgi:glycosyltransferase involved in cell wall biosynthesis
MGILAFAYACEPEKGSEPGVGWEWARLLATLDETIVITRSNNAEPIRRHLPELPDGERPTFVYVDLPSWARWWKRGGRGARVYYVLWQLAALKEARRVRRDLGLDVVWHLTFANVWLGTLAPLAGGRFVLGPVGGGVAPPLRLVPTLGIRGLAFEVARELGRRAGRYANPIARLAWRRADLILAQNEETRAWLPRRYRQKARVFPNALVPDGDPLVGRRVRTAPPTLLFAGRLVPWKGGALAVQALGRLPGWRLIVCGAGPDEPRLRRLADRAGVSSRIDFRGWIHRNDLVDVMRHEADVLLCPSLREEAGLVVAEASAAGLPVVALDRGGPPLLGARRVAISSPDRTARALARAAMRAHADVPHPATSRAEKVRQLRGILSERAVLPPAAPQPPRANGGRFEE